MPQSRPKSQKVDELPIHPISDRKPSLITVHVTGPSEKAKQMMKAIRASMVTLPALLGTVALMSRSAPDITPWS